MDVISTFMCNDVLEDYIEGRRMDYKIIHMELNVDF